MEAIAPLLTLAFVAGVVVLLVQRRRRNRGGPPLLPSPRALNLRPASVRFSLTGLLLSGLAALAFEYLVIPNIADTSWMENEPPQSNFSTFARYFLDGLMIYIYVWLLARFVGVIAAAAIAFFLALAINGVSVSILEAVLVTPLATALYADIGGNLEARFSLAMDALSYAVFFQIEQDLEYWTSADAIGETFEFFLSEPVWFASYALAALVAALTLARATPASATATRRSGGGATSSGSGGRDMREQPHEVTRLALAHALMMGGMGRQKLREKLRYRFRGRPPEPGLDVELLRTILDRLIARDFRFRLFFMACVAVAIVGFLMQNLAILVLPIIAGTIVHIFKAHAERFRMRRMFRADTFDISTVRGHFGLDQEPAADAEPVNVVTYKGYVPFEFAGDVTSRVAFTVDLSRGKDGGQPREVTLGQLYQAVAGSVQQSGDYGVQDLALVHGEDVSGITEIQPHAMIAPKSHVGMEVMAQWFGRDDNRVRHYKWITAESWGRQLIVSYFLRFHISGTVLHAETTQCVMTPPGDDWRKIDRQPPMTFGMAIAWFYGAVLLAPFGVLASAGFGLAKIAEGFNLMFVGGRDGLIRRMIKQNPSYNYGSDPSVRSDMASQAYLHYYQRMDSELHEKALARRILDTTIDFLESRDVDVSTLKESRTTIINSGVLVQGGDVTAQSLAVGQNAKSAVNGGATKGGGSK